LALSAGGGCPADLKASAEAFDQQRAAGASRDEDLGNMNEQIAGMDAAAEPATVEA